MVISTRHALMIAEMVHCGASVKQAFIHSLQMNKNVLETVLLSLHVELRLKEHGGNGYQPY
jgi:nitric oxide reductase NorQ protein